MKCKLYFNFFFNVKERWREHFSGAEGIFSRLDTRGLEWPQRTGEEVAGAKAGGSECRQGDGLCRRHHPGSPGASASFSQDPSYHACHLSTANGISLPASLAP